MTEQTEAPKTELDVLKDRARLMGVEFSNNIGIDTLRARINEKLAADEAGSASQTEASENPFANPADADQNYKPQLDHDGDGKNGGSLPKDAQAPAQAEKPAKYVSPRQAELRERTKLVRCRIVNLNPAKANLPGEIFTVANETVGTVRKFVPYGEATDNGYHLPYCLYRQLVARKFQLIRTVKDKRTGTNRIESKWVKEFAIEILEPLTQDELNKLAAAQAAAGGLED